MNQVTMDPWWTPQEPWVHVPESGIDLSNVTSGVHVNSLTTVLSGQVMSDRADVMREFARAFQFPDYFGGNWSALEDCLRDLTWLTPVSSYLVVITDRDVLLRNGDKRDRSLLVDVLASVGRIWSTLGHGNGPVAFNSVLID